MSSLTRNTQPQEDNYKIKDEPLHIFFIATTIAISNVEGNCPSDVEPQGMQIILHVHVVITKDSYLLFIISWFTNRQFSISFQSTCTVTKLMMRRDKISLVFVEN